MASGEYLSVRSQIEMLEKQFAGVEPGTGPGDLDSPFAAAISSFLSFAVGAAVPLLPFALTAGTAALAAGAFVGARRALPRGRGDQSVHRDAAPFAAVCEWPRSAAARRR